MQATDVIKKPILTEKHTFWSNEANRYAFLVDRRATKTDVKRAIEELYRVKVLGVNTQIRKGGSRRTRFGYVVNKPEKHAMIKVHPDDRIELF